MSGGEGGGGGEAYKRNTKNVSKRVTAALIEIRF